MRTRDRLLWKLCNPILGLPSLERAILDGAPMVPHPLRRFVLLLVLSAVASSSYAIGPKKEEGLEGLCQYSAPELWVVNSRCAPRCCGLEEGFERLTYERYCPEECRFIRMDRESFLAAQANIPTLLFSHGNSLKHKGALESAWIAYNAIKSCPGPKMLVLYSWPAEMLYKRPLIRPVKLLRDNIQAKYVYAEYQGYYVAKLAEMMSRSQPLTLSGHSYGGAMVTIALHYIGGGELNGLVLPTGSPVERPNLRASIVSGAMDNDHVYPGHRYCQAFVAVEKYHTTFSTIDATLKRWPTHSFRGQEAQGYTGLCASRLGENGHKLFQQCLTNDVGKSHYMKEHFGSKRMVAAICETAFNSGVSCCSSCNGATASNSSTPKQVVDLEDVWQISARTVFPGLAL